MAIAGLLVNTLKADLQKAEAEIRAMPEMTTYGCHQDQYVVVVADAPSDQMERAVDRIHAIHGVLTVYTTYVTIEDEIGN
jgi:nitrate reductase NapAB chaperone NapD